MVVVVVDRHHCQLMAQEDKVAEVMAALVEPALELQILAAGVVVTAQLTLVEPVVQELS